MLGRGLLANPCLAEEIHRGAPYPLVDKIQRIRSLHTALLDGYTQRLSGETHQIQKLASHWEYLHTSLPFGAKLYDKARKAHTMAEYQTIIGRAFGNGA